MTRLIWDSKPLYETGVDRGVFYPPNAAGIYTPGVSWNGLVSVDATETETVDTTLYFDGIRQVLLQETSEFAATLEAFTYPYEFAAYDGLEELVWGQVRETFGLSYRTNNGEGYKIHLVYKALANPSTKSWGTMSDSEDLSTFTWDLSTKPVNIPGFQPGAHLVIDTTLANPLPVAELEALLYGTQNLAPTLPSAEQVVAIFEAYLDFVVTYHGDGTWTAKGSAQAIQIFADQSFNISWPTAYSINPGIYQVGST